ncbi:DUF2007 domain-containing protein [Rhodanobacter sp. C05]|uniref:DUF2007 domain-containing protein n=1 Tax=Rhodanobacter sp. C05 TaxID=1945855 RepID=UPI0009D3B095|nr:DUF2007 domain-containing protein [Rhodanobacter sp. C05]OOG38673.1 hypothetical protein B0E51_14175 [Rhodanobacter sp. C05]
MSEQELRRRFAGFSDEVLLERLQSSQLTVLAAAIAQEEAIGRGLALPNTETDAEPDGDDEADAEHAGFVQLKRFLTPTEAHVLLGRLHAEGIDAHTAGLQTVEANPLWTQAMGGVRIFVLASDQARACEILEDIQRGTYNQGESDVDSDKYDELSRAPKDVSTSSHRFGGSVILAIPCLVLAGVAISIIWSTDCPPGTYCSRPVQSSTDELVANAFYTVLSLLPLIAVIARLMWKLRIAARAVSSNDGA